MPEHVHEPVLWPLQGVFLATFCQKYSKQAPGYSCTKYKEALIVKGAEDTLIMVPGAKVLSKPKESTNPAHPRC